VPDSARVTRVDMSGNGARGTCVAH
jgi:hypothetical protein